MFRLEISNDTYWKNRDEKGPPQWSFLSTLYTSPPRVRAETTVHAPTGGSDQTFYCGSDRDLTIYTRVTEWLARYTHSDTVTHTTDTGIGYRYRYRIHIFRYSHSTDT